MRKGNDETRGGVNLRRLASEIFSIRNSRTLSFYLPG